MTKRRIARLAALAATALAAVLAVAVPASAVPAHPSAPATHGLVHVTVASCQSYYGSGTCTAKASVNGPRYTRVHVSSPYGGAVARVHWAAECLNSAGYLYTKGGTSGFLPMRVHIHKAFTYPLWCRFKARGTIPGGGQLRLWITTWLR